MVPSLVTLLVSAGCIAFACQAPAAEGPLSATAGEAVSTSTVVDEYISALGGRDALLHIQNRRAEGVVESGRRGAARVNFQLYWTAIPNQARAEFKEEKLITYEGYDGSKGWTQDFLKITQELKPDALENLLLFADPLRYTHLLEIYSDVAIEKDAPDAGGRTVLRAKAKDTTFRFFFDRQTHFLLEIQRERDTDESAPRRYRFDEYRRVDGILFPFVIHEVMPLPNLDPEAIRIENLIRYKSVKHNVNIPATLFMPPKLARR